MKNELKNALKALESGKTILYPTDTIWGIGCDAMSDNATKKIFEIKRRDYSKGLICLASSFEMVQDYADINEIERYKNASNETPTTFILENPRNISNYVLGNNNSKKIETFTDGLLEYPQYTKPNEFKGMKIPDILLSGNHKAIKEWQENQALSLTKLRRPDLIDKKKDKI